jgi:type IV secretory pathway VirB3-like protein
MIFRVSSDTVTMRFTRVNDVAGIPYLLAPFIWVFFDLGFKWIVT